MKTGVAGVKGLAAATLLGLAAAGSAQATVVVYSFEAFPDGQVITSDIQGLTFGNTIVFEAGSTINEFEFPPTTGTHLTSDDGGAITIDFATPVLSVGAFFNYMTSLSMNFYDSANVLLNTSNSLFGNNLGLSGDPGSSTNEFIGFTAATPLISRVVITGDTLGGSFTMDDLTIDNGQTVPEPATMALALGLLGLGGMPGGWLRRRRPR